MEDYMNEKIKHTFYIILIVVLCLSVLLNIYFIYTNIYNARQARAASERLESELNDTTSSVSSAAGSIESGNIKLDSVSTGLQESAGTTREISANTETSIKRCGDIEQTICDLRKEVEDMENIYNNSDNSRSNNYNDSAIITK